MRRDDSGDIVGDAVDAVTLSQDVQWERCVQLGTPAERRALDRLRALAPLFGGGDGAEPSLATSAAPATPFAGRFTRRVVHVLMALAAGAVAMAVLFLPWRWEDYHREHGDLAVYMTILLVGHGASAGLLLFAGRRDRRTSLLGGYFLFKATVAVPHMLPAFWGQMPPVSLLEASIWEVSTPTRLFLLLYAFPQAYAVTPAFLWAFARECPRVQRRTALDDFARRMVTVSVAIGCAMCAVAAAATAYLAVVVGDAVDDAVYLAFLDIGNATSNVLALAAVVVIARRAHTAPPEEVRRVVLFSAGFLLWIGVATAYDVVEAASPGFWASNYESGSVLLLIQPIRFPGVVLLWYSVLAARVPHPREVIRAGCRRLLMRPGLLGGAAAAPTAALAWRLAGSREQTLGAVIADPVAQSLFAVAGVLVLLVIGREGILRRLDAWFYPEIADQRQVLAAATAALAKAERMASIERTVTRAVRRGCGSPATLLAAGGAKPGRHDLRASDASIAPLPRMSAIVQMLEEAGGSLRVHPSDAKSGFQVLPPEEAAWVEETAADVIVPIPGPAAEVAGLLVVGRRFDDRIVRPVDVPFLEVLAAAASQALGRRRLLEGVAARRSEAAAVECPVCRCIAEAGKRPRCGCGAAYAEAEAPKLLAGKYRLTRRLGAGGTGSVYLARDVELDRDIAVKTLGGVSATTWLSGLKPEARAMARVTHPAVAHIHGVESWRGRPFLVVEFLPRGTLADRLREGLVPAPRAAEVTNALAEGLAALHRAGYVHGDVKPSNIGFTADGTPKLLDFGLARVANDATVAGGTLRYLSPEVLDGRAAGEADDVWSLCVVLYEMVVGEHPFAGGGAAAVADRIRHRRLRRGAGGAETSSALVSFAASVLSASRSARPATARGFAVVVRQALARK